MTNSKTASVSILGQDYNINCASENELILHKSADLLNQQLEILRNSGRFYSLERMVVMAALNISAELVQAKQDAGLNQIACQQLNQRISKVLDTS
jgi:cell division protein ZapA